MHDVSGASFRVLRCVNAYMWATPMGYGSCVVQHLQACGSVGMPIVRVKIFASNNFRGFRKCSPFANICVANITGYLCTRSDII